jgi:hypothetical protein
MTEICINKPKLKLLAAVGIIGYALCTSVFAATLYKWVDENGEIRYSDRVPPSQVKQKRQILNEHGVVIETKEAAKTPEQLEAEKEAKRIRDAELAEERRLKAEQDKHDRVLLLTFSSEEEMMSVRDNRIEVIDSVIRLIENSINTTEIRLLKLEDNAEVLYTSKGQEVPGGLAQNIEFFTRKIENRKEQLRLKQEEKRKIDEQFDEDLTRYRWLKSNTTQ